VFFAANSAVFPEQAVIQTRRAAGATRSTMGSAKLRHEMLRRKETLGFLCQKVGEVPRRISPRTRFE
jgi:hypothetical protein